MKVVRKSSDLARYYLDQNDTAGKENDGKDKGSPKAFIISAVISGGSGDEAVSYTDELGMLAASCGIEVAGSAIQNIKTVNPAFYIGSGKVKEIKPVIDELDIDVVIFDNGLSNTQMRNLEKELDCEIMDRPALILEIFARRAKTREAKLQVEVAKLQYARTRLTGSNRYLGRQSGGVGTWNKGLGEQKLELDRRRIDTKISELNKDLEEITCDRETQRKKRITSELPRVALVGYTNSGKSTLMNTIVHMAGKPLEKKVYEDDMLFATLETSVRNITLPDRKSFLLSDTVGFIRKLPHGLVKAFRSTLKEVMEASLLLIVIDLSDPAHEQQLEITAETLNDIGAGDIPAVYIYNKADLTDMNIPYVKGDRIYISAKERTGISELIEMIKKRVFSNYMKCRMLIPYEHGGVAAYFRENADIRKVEYLADGIMFEMECKTLDFDRYREYAVNGNKSSAKGK